MIHSSKRDFVIFQPGNITTNYIQYIRYDIISVFNVISHIHYNINVEKKDIIYPNVLILPYLPEHVIF